MNADFGVRSAESKNASQHFAIRESKAWNMKSFIRLIVTSATYRQSSKITPQLQEKDAYNRWLARAPRMRVEAEIVRDVAFPLADCSAKKLAGLQVYPPIPDGVLSLGYGAQFPWPTDKAEDRYRRGMYTFWKRNVPYPSLSVFDSPNGDFSCTRRVQSNTPLQALTTLNDVMFMEAAQGLALRTWKEGGTTDQEKLATRFGSVPDANRIAFEVGEFMKLLNSQRAEFKGKTSSAVYVTSMDVNNIPDGMDLHELAPWTMVARVLLNMDETITKE